ncbi:MAG: bifunctional nuclease family protein [Gemmatimonadaceae bacterium]|nr:bifunctional nuclease family protein [Gemmatimonadaceae bacterium]
MIEVRVARLGVDSAANTYVLVLREAEGGRVLPIWIGQPEAEAIVVELQSVRRERPMTHDLLKHVITGLGATVRRVVITRVERGTYYADLHLEQRDGTLVTVDARPSDSIALALRTGATILAAEELLVELAEDDEEEDGDGAPPSPPTGGAAPTRPADMSADELKAYLQRLRPEDFGKFTPRHARARPRARRGTPPPTRPPCARRDRSTTPRGRPRRRPPASAPSWDRWCVPATRRCSRWAGAGSRCIASAATAPARSIRCAPTARDATASTTASRVRPTRCTS